MTERVVVETKCPQCGAPLDFSESSHAVRCGHCRTALLVTGRRQLLSFWIRPRAERPRSDARLVFLPYYRFTAHDLAWKSRTPEPKKSIEPGSLGLPAEAYTWGETPKTTSIDLADGLVSLVGAAFESIDWLIDRIEGAAAKVVGAPDASPAPAPAPLPLPARASAAPARGGLLSWDAVELDGRRLERNFLALDVSRPALFSIGVRAAVLRLELFQRDALREHGTIAPVSLPPQEAIGRALGRSGREILYRTTVAQALSLIWFPYWFIGGGGGPLTVVDGVAGSVVDRGFPPELFRELTREMSLEPKTVGFRPLTCPNCGWDLPLREDDTVFFCGSCGRAWQLERSDLRAIDAEIAETPRERGEERMYLPFWVVTGSTEEGERRYFAPAFAYRSVEAVHRLAWSLTGHQPEWGRAPSTPEGEKAGCLYDQSDGVRIAQFLHVRSQMRKGGDPDDEFEGLPVSKVVLTWLPFEKRGAMLFEPFTGANLYVNLVG